MILHKTTTGYIDAICSGYSETWVKDSAINAEKISVVCCGRKRYNRETRKQVTVKELMATGFVKKESFDFGYKS